ASTCSRTRLVARALATSPAACPPIPSATTYNPSPGSTSIASSLCWRFLPTSVRPKASVVRSKECSRRAEGRRLKVEGSKVGGGRPFQHWTFDLRLFDPTLDGAHSAAQEPGRRALTRIREEAEEEAAQVGPAHEIRGLPIQRGVAERNAVHDGPEFPTRLRAAFHHPQDPTLCGQVGKLRSVDQRTRGRLESPVEPARQIGAEGQTRHQPVLVERGHP